jgi:hypothetical protein
LTVSSTWVERRPIRRDTLCGCARLGTKLAFVKRPPREPDDFRRDHKVIPSEI